MLRVHPSIYQCATFVSIQPRRTRSAFAGGARKTVAAEARLLPLLEDLPDHVDNESNRGLILVQRTGSTDELFRQRIYILGDLCLGPTEPISLRTVELSE